MKEETWPAEDLESVPNCPVCGGTARSLLYAGLSDRVFGVAPGIWSLYRCTGCASAWLDPRPTQASIGKAYDGYFTHIPDGDKSVLPKNRFVWLLHSWLNDYKNAKFGSSRLPAGIGGRWLVSLLPPLRAKAGAECRHMPRLPVAGGNLLDVGFGNGGFLKLAREMGWEVEGIDFDPQAVAVATEEGLNVQCASVDDLLRRNQQYDVITLSHVIEHVCDPVVLLGNLYRLLKPGGRLWLETPNIDSNCASFFGSNWRGWEPPRHLVLFNLDSLRKGLRNAGFDRIHQHWHGMVSLSIYTASATMRRGELGRDAVPEILPPMSALFIEFMGMVRPSRREFLTITARKPL